MVGRSAIDRRPGQRRIRRRCGGRDRTGVCSSIRRTDGFGSPQPGTVFAHGGTVAAMPIPRRYTTDAIVLSRFDLGEADRVLTLITPTGGKLKAIAKGIRKPTSRLGGSLEPFAELTVALARGRTFDVVTQVSVRHAWLRLRDSLESAATAWYLAELPDRSPEEPHAPPPLYALLRRAYEILGA